MNGNAEDEDDSDRIDKLLLNRIGEKTKFDFYKVPLYFLRMVSVRIAIYLGSWLIRVAYLLISYFVRDSIFMKKVGYYHYVLHLMIFSTFILDAPFYASRTILHSKWGYNELLVDKIAAVLSIWLITYDLLYLLHVALNLHESNILTLKSTKKSSVGIEAEGNKKKFTKSIAMILGKDPDRVSKMNRLRVLKQTQKESWITNLPLKIAKNWLKKEDAGILGYELRTSHSSDMAYRSTSFKAVEQYILSFTSIPSLLDKKN